MEVKYLHVEDGKLLLADILSKDVLLIVPTFLLF